MAARVSASGKVIRIVISVPVASGLKLVSARLSGVRLRQVHPLHMNDTAEWHQLQVFAIRLVLKAHLEDTLRSFAHLADLIRAGADPNAGSGRSGAPAHGRELLVRSEVCEGPTSALGQS